METTNQCVQQRVARVLKQNYTTPYLERLLRVQANLGALMRIRLTEDPDPRETENIVYRLAEQSFAQLEQGEEMELLDDIATGRLIVIPAGGKEVCHE